MARTFEMKITCEDDDYDAFSLQGDIEDMIRHRYDREDVEVELQEMARW